MAQTQVSNIPGPLPGEKLAPSTTQWDKLDVPIEHFGRAITLPAEPENMPLDKAIEALLRRKADDEQMFVVAEVIDAYPLDAAVAFVKAMANLYGWASPQTIMTFFGPKPPAMISVKTGYRDEDVIQCPVGAFLLPGVDEKVITQIGPIVDNGPDVFRVVANIKKRDRHLVLELVTEARRIVREQSIYKGRPIRLGVDDYGRLLTNDPPEFMNVRDTTEADLLFDAEIAEQINTNILVPMKETARCRQHKIPLKRGVLLEGPFGTGKTLTARMTANVAEQHGWTFVLLDRIQGLRAALEFAKRYQPAVVFAEDIDRIAELRTDSVNDLIITIDGVVNKQSEIMIVLTTNFVKKLDPVILRPGRLDAVISLRPPTAKTVEKLLRHYAGRLLPEKEVLVSSGNELSGQIPASIRECVERAKLGMIGRRAHTLSDLDLVVAAKTMKNHLALLNRDDRAMTPAEQLADSLHHIVQYGPNGGDQAEAEH